MDLFHYYEKVNKPFLTLSDLTDEELQLGKDNNTLITKHVEGDYMFYRHLIEKTMYEQFIKKGGRPTR